ncbi:MULTISPECIES: SAM-dependent methyltransferase [unclassified Streptomyces]|uniref:SAM-dependent methyltransferase n=1 Tax=unclassified Streptomyces TaxID=2593676 RepID=UPI003409BD9D
MIDGLKFPEGVGQTALVVAWTRQMESRRPDALFHDPFADELLRAIAEDQSFAEVSDMVTRASLSTREYPTYFAVRTRFFDDELLTAMRAGIRQVVTLAAGVDGRTLRLDCPPGTRWYELDLPDMTAFKDALIANSRLAATCERHGVAADLTANWPDALREAGFDPGLPTAWLVEGLLMYLSDEEGDALLSELSALSAPGSRIMLEQLAAVMLGEEGKPSRERLASQGARWRSARDDVQAWLAGHGWHAEVYSGADPRIGHGRTVSRLPACWVATGTLTKRADAAPAG